MVIDAGVGLLAAGDHLEQRRLAGAVGADDADDAGAGKREREVLDQQTIAEALAQPVDLDDGVAEPRAGRDGDLQLLVVGSAGLRLGLQLLVGGEARLALGLAGLRRHADPLQLAFEGATAGDVRPLLAGEAFLLLLQPRAVVARERDAAAAIELEDPLGDVVEEVAVVGDRHDRAGVVLQELLEPVDALGVEVVGRLVEQQQVGAAEQQPAQRDAAPLAAGQRGRRRRRRAGSAGRPWRSRRCARGSTRRRRRSCPRGPPARRRSCRSRRQGRPTSPSPRCTGR